MRLRRISRAVARLNAWLAGTAAASAGVRGESLGQTQIDPMALSTFQLELERERREEAGG